MEMLGVPLEERKKAYAGVDLSTLITKYNQAEKQGDLPTMLALLDIIKAAPKGKTPPTTTVKDDIMAQAMPQSMPQMQPQPTVPGFEGAVTSMENQAGLNPPTLMAASGGAIQDVMRDGNAYDDQPGRDEYAHGGITKLQAGGLPPYNVATASMDDLVRFAQFGDPKAAEELVRRQTSGFRFRPASELNRPMPPGVSAEQAFANRPGVAPGSTPLSPSPAATPTAGTPPTSLMRRGLGALRRFGPYGVAASLAIPAVGDVLMSTDTGAASEEQDPLTAMQGTIGQQERPGAAPMPAVAPAGVAPPGAGGGPGVGAPPTGGVPGISSFDLSAFKPRTAADYSREQEDYIASQVAAGKIPSEKDILKREEERAAGIRSLAQSDRAAAKETFKENLLLNAALAAPQFLRGRGLSQATARFGETFAPMALETAAQKSKSLKEATKFERDAEDKLRQAEIDMAKSTRAAAEGRFGRGQELESKALQNYLTASVQKYVAELGANAQLIGITKLTIQEALKSANEQIKLELINPDFKALSPEKKLEKIQFIRENALDSVRQAINQELPYSIQKNK